jgi:hypothetical protein
MAINLQWIKERVRLIKSVAKSDPKAAHDVEMEVYVAVLKECGTGNTDAPEFAKYALQTQQFKLEWWK